MRLLLNSIRINSNNLFKPYILYKASNNDFLEGYNKLQQETSNWFDIDWIEENYDLKTEFLKFLYLSDDDSQLCCLTTDDCIVYRPTDLNFDDIQDAFCRVPKLASYSFRLGYNTIIQNHRTGEHQEQLIAKNLNDKIIYWNSNHYNPYSNYGYIYGMDFSSYRSKDLIKITEQFEELPNFRAWEGCLSNPTRQTLRKDIYMMASEKQSLVVNFPLNAVQEEAYGTTPLRVVTPEELNSRYLAGEVIDLRSFDFSNVIGAHQEFNFKFKKED